MSFWQEKTEFWRNKTLGNQIYMKQAEEVRRDLKKIEKLVAARDVTYLDVGGYDGRIGVGDVIDIFNGFDITKDWKEQWESPNTRTNQPRNLQEKYNVVFTSLTLITFPPDQVHFILSEIKKVAKDYVYLFEEERIGGKSGDQVNDEYGGKWQYDWAEELTKAGFTTIPMTDFKASKVNGRWTRGIIKVR